MWIFCSLGKLRTKRNVALRIWKTFQNHVRFSLFCHVHYVIMYSNHITCYVPLQCHVRPWLTFLFSWKVHGKLLHNMSGAVIAPPKQGAVIASTILCTSYSTVQNCAVLWITVSFWIQYTTAVLFSWQYSRFLLISYWHVLFTMFF